MGHAQDPSVDFLRSFPLRQRKSIHWQPLFSTILNTAQRHHYVSISNPCLDNSDETRPTFSPVRMFFPHSTQLHLPLDVLSKHVGERYSSCDPALSVLHNTQLPLRASRSEYFNVPPPSYREDSDCHDPSVSNNNSYSICTETLRDPATTVTGRCSSTAFLAPPHHSTRRPNHSILHLQF